MNAKVILFLFCLVVFVHAQSREVKLIIDPFTPDTDTLIIQIFANSTFPAVRDAFTQDSGIVGGERDLHLELESGPRGSIFSSSVANEEWSVATPPDASGFAYMQYDGTDRSPDLDFTGLDGANFRLNGADAFVIDISSDINTSYLFQITDMTGVQSLATLPVNGGSQFTRYELPYTRFNGTADFSNIGSFEILINAGTDVDTVIDILGIIGPVISPSRTPTPTPSPNPSIVPSPSPSPTPLPQGPRFTWYTFDDDDNGREPCEDERPRPDYFFNDDNILYYYFVGTFDDYVTLSSTNSAPVVAASALLGLIALMI